MNTPNQTINEQPGKEFLILFSIIAFIVNLLAFLNSYTKGGWAQVGLLFNAPIYNGLFMLAGAVIVFKMRKSYPNASMGLFWICTIALPLILLAAVILLTLQFPRGGAC